MPVKARFLVRLTRFSRLDKRIEAVFNDCDQIMAHSCDCHRMYYLVCYLTGAIRTACHADSTLHHVATEAMSIARDAHAFFLEAYPDGRKGHCPVPK